MRSDTILIDNKGNGFDNAIKETAKAAEYCGLEKKDALYLQLCTEEILSLARSVTGEMQASFWLENEGKQYTLHMSTKAVLDKEKRSLLIASSTTGRNEAAKTFLGQIRDSFERAMAADADHSNMIPEMVMSDVSACPDDSDGWDWYERSILKKVSDQVKITIRGKTVELTVVKTFV